MLKRFTLVWIAYWLIYMIQPVHSIYGGVWEAYLLQLSFVLAVIIGFVFVPTFVTQANNSELKEQCDIGYEQQIAIVGYALSFVGLAMLAYDKIGIQGIDYSLSISSAREQWRILGEERAGEASSIYSMLGYVLGSAYFFSLAIVCSRNVLLDDGRRLILFLVGVTLLMGNSLLTGGRSGILLLFAFVSYAYFSSKGTASLFKSNKFQFILWGGIVASIGYALYVFILRAEGGGNDLAEYSLEFLDYLGLEPSDWFVSFAAESKMGELLSLANLAAAYLTHSMSTVAAMWEYSGDREVVVLTYYFSLLQKLGVGVGEAEAWFLAGRFPSLPGGLFHQFGLYWMLIAGVALGWIGGFVSALHRLSRNSYFLLLACCATEAVLLLSPFLFAGDFLFFPFVMFGGIISIHLVNFLSR